jgi:hypothetical protein
MATQSRHAKHSPHPKYVVMRATFSASGLCGPFLARNQKPQTQDLSELFDNSQMQQHNHAK